MEMATKKMKSKQQIELKYPDILFDDTGYPSEESLEFIKSFDFFKIGFNELANFIKLIWWNKEKGFVLKRNKLILITGGWSGNEDIISALQNNYIFWGQCWQKSERGGRYTFKIKNIPKK